MSDTYSIDDLDPVFELLAASWGWPLPETIIPALRSGFLESNRVDPEALSLYDLILGLAYAMNNRFGVWLDHGEAYLLEEKCAAMIDRAVGRPDGVWPGQESYADFAWSGSAVGDGLAAFDRWLVADSLLAAPGHPPLRLVGVDTGSDFYVGIGCRENRVDELIELLAGFGINANLFNS